MVLTLSAPLLSSDMLRKHYISTFCREVELVILIMTWDSFHYRSWSQPVFRSVPEIM